MEGSEANSWSKYYQDLATPADDETFDNNFLYHVQLTHLLTALNTSGQTLPLITDNEVQKHLERLRNGKAADIYGITAEHMKWASSKIVNILGHLINLIVRTARLPDELKIGSISPVHKKNKPYKLPTYYRRITITALISKVVSCHILLHTDAILNTAQSRLQFGFTSDLAPIFAAVLMTEIIAQAIDNNEQLLITFMDTSKAFDVVHHDCLLNAMQLQGVEGTLWKLYDSMYTGGRSVVKWKDEFSDAIEEKQGIKQGEKTATSCYKAGKNRLLNRLDISPSLHIGSISAGALMVADDLAIASRNPHDMQAALYTAEMDASRERYKFNTDKTKTLAINYKQQPTLILNKKPLTISSKEVHLGIHRTSDGKIKATIGDRINSARSACYAMRDAGLHGAGPEIAMAQYAHYVLPTLLYGFEALVIKGECLEELEKYHLRTSTTSNTYHSQLLWPSTYY